MSQAEQVAAHRDSVRRLSEPGGPLSLGNPRATVRNPEWFSDPSTPLSGRRLLHSRLIDEYRADFAAVPRERKAVVLAGPPGAGKSTVLKHALGEDGDKYLRVDPDEFKAKLLREAIADGSYETKIKPDEVKALDASGDRYYPMDMAALVHEESSFLAMRLRTEAIANGENLIIDGVLSDPEYATDLGRTLARAGYDVEVIDVEIPYEASAQSISNRWEQDYTAALEGRHDLGGRWVPDEYAQYVFDGPDGRSRPEHAAENLAQTCPEVSRFRRYRGAAADQPRTLETDLHRSRPGAPLTPTPDPRAAKPVTRTRHTSIQPRHTTSRGD